MSISLRLAVPPSTPAHAPALRRPPKSIAGSNGINAIAIASVALQPPHALRCGFRLWQCAGELRFDRRVRGACSRGGAAGETPPFCCASAHVSAETMRWMSVGAAAILMLARGTAIHKSFLVPFVALQAPSSVISWIKGDYGQWTAFLALLLRLLYFIPGELELPLSTMLLVSIAPYQLINLRGTEDSAITVPGNSNLSRASAFHRGGRREEGIRSSSNYSNLIHHLHHSYHPYALVLSPVRL